MITERRAVTNLAFGDRTAPVDVLKIPGTTTFFINGAMFEGVLSFEELEKKIKPLLKS